MRGAAISPASIWWRSPDLPPRATLEYPILPIGWAIRAGRSLRSGVTPSPSGMRASGSNAEKFGRKRDGSAGTSGGFGHQGRCRGLFRCAGRQRRQRIGIERSGVGGKAHGQRRREHAQLGFEYEPKRPAATIDQFLRSEEARARGILRRRWRDVEAIAQALQNRGMIWGSDLHRIVGRAA